MVEFKEITGVQLQPLIENTETVLVDFYMPNCGPCSMQKMILKDLAKTAEDMEIVAMEVSCEPEIMEQYEISTAPFLILFHNGQVANRMLGLQQKATLLNAIQAL